LPKLCNIVHPESGIAKQLGTRAGNRGDLMDTLLRREGKLIEFDRTNEREARHKNRGTSVSNKE
jgi:regulator of extracellular matrix RemA (YlzA/DUF370 family)